MRLLFSLGRRRNTLNLRLNPRSGVLAMNRLTVIAVLLLGIVPQTAAALATTYTFEVLSAIYWHESDPSVTGILIDTTDSVTIKLPRSSSVLERCAPMFLTAIENSGKYLLSIRVNYDEGGKGPRVLACGLQLRF